MMQPINGIPSTGIKFDFSGRDFACLVFALAVHSTLLLWKGGMLSLPESGNGGMGDMLVNVDFRSDIPSYEPAGGGTGPKQSFFSKVKSLVRGERPGAKSEVAMGQQTAVPVEPAKPAWNKPDALTDKPFQKKGFDGLAKKDELDISKGQTQQVLVQPSKGNFQKSEPNLKENKFKVAQKDMPFKIIDSNAKDQLVNVNAIPVETGNKTSSAVRSLSGGPGSGPALQTKAFAPKGSASSGGFSGSSSSHGGGSSGGLAMGGASVGGPAGSTGSGSGAAGSGGNGYGAGSGSGTGSGHSSGSGFGSGGGGRSYGGGSGFGGTGTQMSTLPRNTVSESQPAGMKSVSDGRFNITGALANRPIVQKSFARYEIDCRVALRFRVNANGNVLDGIIVEVSSGSPTFDQKVISSLQQWIFSRLPAGRSNEIQEGVVTFVFRGV